MINAHFYPINLQSFLKKNYLDNGTDLSSHNMNFMWRNYGDTALSVNERMCVSNWGEF